MNHKIISNNNAATFDFNVERTIEAGVELRGWEVKSLRIYGVSLKSSFCSVHQGEVYWKEASIKDYIGIHDSKRIRKLLLSKRQIYKWYGEMSKSNLTIIPLKCYFKNHRYFKILLGLCSKSKKFDQREKIKQKDLRKSQRQSELYY